MKIIKYFSSDRRIGFIHDLVVDCMPRYTDRTFDVFRLSKRYIGTTKSSKYISCQSKYNYNTMRSRSRKMVTNMYSEATDCFIEDYLQAGFYDC